MILLNNYILFFSDLQFLKHIIVALFQKAFFHYKYFEVVEIDNENEMGKCDGRMINIYNHTKILIVTLKSGYSHETLFTNK